MKGNLDHTRDEQTRLNSFQRQAVALANRGMLAEAETTIRAGLRDFPEAPNLLGQLAWIYKMWKPGVRLTDARGGPMRDVKVSLYRSQGNMVTLPWSAKTDSEGRFRMDHAPTGPTMFRFERNGSSHYYSATLPSAKELTFAWRGSVRLAGKTIDAVTKKPVEQTVRVRGVFSKNGSTSSWTTSGQRGFFTLSLGSSAGDYTNFALTIEAPGYEGLTTNMPAMDLVSATNVYELKKAKMLEGVVVAPDGSPASKTELVVLEPTHSAYMDEPGKFRQQRRPESVAAQGPDEQA